MSKNERSWLLLSLALLVIALMAACVVGEESEQVPVELDAGEPVALDAGEPRALASPTAPLPPRQTFNNIVVPYLGTIDETPLSLYINGETALTLSPTISSPNIIAGHWSNLVTGTVGAVVAGGGTLNDENAVGGNYGVVGGGHGNVAGVDAAVAGGAVNAASGEGSFASGANNTASGSFSQAVGKQNTAAGDYATVDGGLNNNSAGDYAVIGGGNGNVVAGESAVVAGGIGNQALSNYGVIGGGYYNTITDTVMVMPEEQPGNTIGGGYANLTEVGVQYSTIGGGAGNEVAPGVDCATIPGGYGARADHHGAVVHASGYFSVTGDAQVMELILIGETTSGSARELTFNGFTSTSMHYPTIPEDTTWLFDVRIVARRTDADNESAAYWYRGAIDNNAGTVALIGSVSEVLVLEDTGAWAVAITADNTNDRLKIAVTGEAAKTIQWVAEVRIVQTTG